MHPLTLPDHVPGLQTPSTQGYPLISPSLSPPGENAPTANSSAAPLLFHPSSFLISTEYCVYRLFTSCSGGLNLPRPPVLASGCFRFDRLRRACDRLIIGGTVVLVVICTGKCWPCCCFMYLFLPHTGKCLFSTVYRVRLLTWTLPPSRIAPPFFKARRLFFSGTSHSRRGCAEEGRGEWGRKRGDGSERRC